jgi:hypothetical protein
VAAHATSARDTRSGFALVGLRSNNGVKAGAAPFKIESRAGRRKARRRLRPTLERRALRSPSRI